jgi:hypothetical protein
MASKWFGKGLLAVAKGDVAYLTDDIVAILCESGYTPAQDTHEFISDLTNECADASYSRVTLTTKALTYDGATNKVKYTADPIVFTGLDETFRTLVLAVDSGSDATSRLLKWSDYTTDQTANGVDTTITPDATDGLMKITAD